MSYETLITQKESGIGKIIMNRPEAMNAITPNMLKELKAAVLEAGRDSDVKIIVLTGAGKAFCAGVDLKSLGDREVVGGKVGDILDVPARELINAIRTAPKVVIALVNGFCFTGAMEIMLGCDMVIAQLCSRTFDSCACANATPLILQRFFELRASAAAKRSPTCPSTMQAQEGLGAGGNI